MCEPVQSTHNLQAQHSRQASLPSVGSQGSDHSRQGSQGSTGSSQLAVSHSRTSSSGSSDGLLLSVANLASRGKKPQQRSTKQDDAVSLKSESEAVADCEPKRQQRCYSAHQSDVGSDNNSLSSDLSLEQSATAAAPAAPNCDKNEFVFLSGRTLKDDVLSKTVKDTREDCVMMGAGESAEDILRPDPEGLADSEGGGATYTSYLSVDKRLFGRLQEELSTAQSELRIKEEEVTRLSKIRDEVEAELEDLTASLFQEAHRMVREANVKAFHAEKSLAESNMQIDGLETEVAALKTLVITSTPAMPNKHLHPHIDIKNGRGKGASSAPGSPAKERSMDGSTLSDGSEAAPERHIDPVLRQEYLQWKKTPTMDRDHVFLARIYSEDIIPCLDFPNKSLGEEVTIAVHANTLAISPVTDLESQQAQCALMQMNGRCQYVVRLTDEDKEFSICSLSRNRIAAVCDFVTYCRYVTQGLVKSHTNDVYWEMMERRKQMTLARLGFTTS